METITHMELSCNKQPDALEENTKEAYHLAKVMWSLLLTLILLGELSESSRFSVRHQHFVPSLIKEIPKEIKRIMSWCTQLH